MPAKTKSKSRSRTSQSAKKNNAFHFTWWMGLIGVMVIAVVGIVIIQFSNAGTLSVNAPVTRNKQAKLSHFFNQCADQFPAPSPSHPLPNFVTLPDASMTGPDHKNHQMDMLSGEGYISGSSYGAAINNCYQYVRAFLNVVTNDTSTESNTRNLNDSFSNDIKALRITIDKLVDIRQNKCNAGDQASCDALNYFRGLGMLNGDNHIPFQTGAVDSQLTAWMNFFSYLYLTSTPVS